MDDLKTMTQQVRDNTFLDRMMSTLSSRSRGSRRCSRRRALRRAGLHGVAADARDRPAHGARRGAARVRAMVLRQVAWMAAVGGVIGLAGAFALGRGAEALLFGIKGYDPVVLGRLSRGAGARRAGRRIDSGVPRVAGRSDDGAAGTSSAPPETSSGYSLSGVALPSPRLTKL